MKQDYWNLVKEIAEKVGNQKVVEQANENIDAINKKIEKLENQEKLLANL
jgi:polyhydroxyalkanoate synthesis regulator phasin